MAPTNEQILLWALMFLVALGVLGFLWRIVTKPVGFMAVVGLLGWVMYLSAIGKL